MSRPNVLLNLGLSKGHKSSGLFVSIIKLFMTVNVVTLFRLELLHDQEGQGSNKRMIKCVTVGIRI